MGPVGLTIDNSNGYLYVVISSHYVDCVNPKTNNIQSRISVGNYSQGICFDQYKGYIYVACETGIVSIINSSTNRVIKNISMGGGPLGITFDDDNGNIYATNQQINTINIINGKTNTEITINTSL